MPKYVFGFAGQKHIVFWQRAALSANSLWVVCVKPVGLVWDVCGRWHGLILQSSVPALSLRINLLVFHDLYKFFTHSIRNFFINLSSVVRLFYTIYTGPITKTTTYI